MKDRQWVQHVSGKGEKWELTDDGRLCNEDPTHPCWVVWREGERTNIYMLPKSEYRLCDPPEVWVDVTEDCKVSPLAGSELSHEYMKVYLPMGYRLRKVRCCDAGGLDCTCGKGDWAIIVEQKVQP